MFASCPQYPHGVVDPIEDLAAIAKSKGIGMHVDCCLGSFIVAFMRKSGFDFPLFDFAVPGNIPIFAPTSLLMHTSPPSMYYNSLLSPPTL